MINIANIIQRPGIGGNPYNVELICRYFNKDKFNLSVIFFETCKGSRENNFRNIPKINIYSAENSYSKLIKLLNNNNIEIVYHHYSGLSNSESDLINSIKKSNIKYLIGRNIFGIYTNSYEDKLYDGMIFPSKYTFYKFLSSSGYDKEYLNNYMPIYNPIEIFTLSKIKKYKFRGNLLRNKFNIPKDNIVIGQITRKDNTKWGQILTESINNISEKLKKCYFVFLGATDNFKAYLQKFPLLKNKLIFFEESANMNEIYTIYSMIDIFIHDCIKGESFGRTLAEAQMLRIPVVTTLTPGYDLAQAELVKHSNGGFITSSVYGFTQAVILLSENQALRNKMGNKGREWVKENFSINKTINKLELYFENIIQNKRNLASNFNFYTFFKEKLNQSFSPLFIKQYLNEDLIFEKELIFNLAKTEEKKKNYIKAQKYYYEGLKAMPFVISFAVNFLNITQLIFGKDSIESKTILDLISKEYPDNYKELLLKWNSNNWEEFVNKFDKYM